MRQKCEQLDCAYAVPLRGQQLGRGKDQRGPVSSDRRRGNRGQAQAHRGSRRIVQRQGCSPQAGERGRRARRHLAASALPLLQALFVAPLRGSRVPLCQRDVAQYVEQYNTKRLQSALHYLTPTD